MRSIRLIHGSRIAEFVFKPESLTGFTWFKTHAVKVTVEHPVGMEENFAEIYLDGTVPPIMNRFFPAYTVATYKEHRAGR